MTKFRCPRCGNYTYNEDKPCPKCGLDFENCEERVLKIKNCIDYVVYYTFAFNQDVEYKIYPNHTKTIKLRDHIVLKLYFYTDDKDKLSYKYCHYIYSRSDYSDMLIAKNGDKYYLYI